MSDINSLILRVTALEGEAGAPVITGTSPSSGTRTGGLLTIIGANFNAEPRRNIVRLGSAVLTPLAGGSSSTISVQIPLDLEGVPGQFTLNLENEGQRSNSVQVTISERDFAQFGEFDIGPALTPEGTMLAGQRLEISWDVFADTALPDEMSLTLIVTNTDGADASDWPEPTFDPPSQTPMSVNQTRNVTMTVTPPAGAIAADLALDVQGIEAKAVGRSQPPVEWRAGRPLEVSDPRATIAITGSNGGIVEDEDMDVSGSTFHGLEVPRLTVNGGIQLELTFGDAFTTAGVFEVSAFVESDEGNWTINPPSSPTISGLPPTQDADFVVQITNTSGNTGDVTMLRVQARQTGTNGDLEPFTTYALIPLRLT